MSIWADLQDRCSGEVTRKEDPVTITEEEIINFVEKKMSVADFTEEMEREIKESISKVGLILDEFIFTRVNDRLKCFSEFFKDYLVDNYLSKKKAVRIPVYDNLKTMVFPETVYEGKVNIPYAFEKIRCCYGQPDEYSLNWDIINDLSRKFSGYYEMEQKDDEYVALIIYPYKTM